MLESVAVKKVAGLACLLGLSLGLLASDSAEASDPKVSFDVPAIVGAKLVTCEGHLADLDKQIEIVVPVTSELSGGDHESISVFRFDIYWSRLAYPLVDYAPKTQTASSIAGNVLVEQVNEKKAGVGLNLGGSDALIKANGSIDLGTRETSKTKFEQIPQQELLVASGTSHRGMGAFFRFHPSKHSVLEGGRELRLRFQVPDEWRGGVLRVDCFAEGSRVVLPGWSDPFEFSRTFVLPVYLATDAEARSAAADFVRSEQGLRQQWNLSRSVKANRSPHIPGFPVLPNWLSRSTSPTDRSLPDQWVHYLIQSGDDAYLRKYRSQLPPSLADSADQFVAARQRLLTFSRR